MLLTDLSDHSDLLGLDPSVALVLLGITLALCGATAFRGILVVRCPGDGRRRGWRSLATWWLLHGLFVTLVVLGRPAVFLALVAVSLLALHEALRLVSKPGLFLPLAVVGGGLYLWGWLDWTLVFTRVLPPLLVLLLLPALLEATRLVLSPGSSLSGVCLAFLAAVLGLSFLAGAASLPSPPGLPGSPDGWLVLLVVLTEFNDMAQAWWGRSLGSRAMAPTLSPSKTWEGLLGGVASTVTLAVLLAPLLTPYGRLPPPTPGGMGPSWLWSAGLGLLLALAGTAGDLTASMLKRRGGVKDSGRLLPAHGGVLDRFDSLTLTSPVFFLVTYGLWIRPS